MLSGVAGGQGRRENVARETRVGNKVDQHYLDTLILRARTQNGWLDQPVTDAQLRQIYDIMKQSRVR